MAAIAVSAAAAQTLSETGSSVMAPLFALWGPAYHTRYSQVTLRTASSSSGAGISSAAAVRAQDLRAFRSWAVTSGTARLARVNFEPLPPSIVTVSTAQIAKIKG